MTFTAGDRVRFTASFADADGEPFDPVAVTATVTEHGQRVRAFSRADGGLARLAPGVWSVDVLLDLPGPLDVRFESTGAGQESWKSARYDVLPELAAEIELAELDLPAAVPDDAESDYLDSDDGELAGHEVSERDAMLAELAAAGIAIDHSRSDAYVAGAHKMLVQSRETPRAAYVRRQRSGE